MYHKKELKKSEKNGTIEGLTTKCRCGGMVDALDSKSSLARGGGSSPLSGTNMSENEHYYKRLLEVVLESVEVGSVMVIGPLGVGTDAFESNIVRFEKAQKDLEEDGYTVFNQLPYLDIFLNGAPHEHDTKFEIFYKGLIQSGNITTLFVLQGYESSKGTILELSYAQEKEVPVIYL